MYIGIYESKSEEEGAEEAAEEEEATRVLNLRAGKIMDKREDARRHAAASSCTRLVYKGGETFLISAHLRERARVYIQRDTLFLSRRFLANFFYYGARCAQRFCLCERVFICSAVYVLFFCFFRLCFLS